FPSHGTPSSTDDMTGGPGFEGMMELQNFLDDGGTIITLGNSARFVAETGLTRTLSSYSASGLAHPGSVVRAMARQPDHPFMYGYPDTTHIFRGNFPLWRTALRDRGTIVLQYGTKPLADEVETTGDMLGMPDEPEPTPAEGDGDDEDSDMEGEDESPEDEPYVLSGDVRGSDSIIGHGAIFDLPAGAGDAGRIVVFSFNPMHRYLNHHDAPMVFNALLNWND
ncbi:MAG: peptidase, partial [Gammaproteobacteria bacterium]|nr:peptidase [Gammaproteobacteria bacterium]